MIYDITTTWSRKVVLIKLAERLHNMRTLDYIDEDRKLQKSAGTIRFFIPLAKRLGNQKIMDELANLNKI